METVSLALITVALVLAGGALTFVFGTLLSAPFLERVQGHGRFAGLGSSQSQSDADSGKRTGDVQPTGYQGRLQVV